MPHFLNARVTHLEMYKRPAMTVPSPLNLQIAIMRAYHMPVHFYRYLYEQIGKAHHWNVRRKMTDAALKDLIQSENTVIHILYVDGCPAGFAEINLKELPKSAEIVYFGLVPDYQGRGLSYFFLTRFCILCGNPIRIKSLFKPIHWIVHVPYSSTRNVVSHR
ncbi:hypothetical protein BBC0244_014690 [Bartonella apihabitans]|nr:hypothetical protein BBC0244_014690 [Bartonella apihabitans]